jgi:peptidyl-prolyl cis-trans isomerase SurA
MVKQLIALVVMVIVLPAFVYSQGDPVLFTVNKKPVHLSEFNYIYSKTNGDKADYSQASLDEYLELYENFKLKVERAKEMQLDTISSLQRELAGYRRQLANSYLVDKEVTERLVQEAYERSLKDVDISHIMILLTPNASDKEVLIAEQKIMNIQKKLKAGESFEDLAKQFSEDKNTKENGGALGFFTALFPDGFYELESAAYNTPVGQVSGMVRTIAGLHLVKVNHLRDARGEMEVAHILIRNDAKGRDSTAHKAKIDSLYQLLRQGQPFEEIAKQYSEDKRTAPKGGYIGFIGIRQVSKDFEDTAFGILKDNGISEPVESSIGWHIIKRISKKEIDPEDIAKRRIQTKMQENKKKSKTPKYNRLNKAEQSMLNRIKKEGNFIENKKIIDDFVTTLDSSFITYKWKAPENKPEDVIFTLGNDFKATLAEFQDFCQRNSKRMRMGNQMEIPALVNLMYDEFVDENCMKYEESQLDVKYPEFKSLMREYEEGILLFEATKILVWDKASQDSVGLAEFYSSHKDNYKWNERAVASHYTLKAEHADLIDKVQKEAKKNTAEEVLEKFNKEEPVLSVQEKVFEKDKSTFPEKLSWAAESVSEVEVNKRSKALSFYKIEKILPPSEKTLKEARGYVIADYQDYLDKKWLEELKKDYKVKVNHAVFESLVKK